MVAGDQTGRCSMQDMVLVERSLSLFELENIVSSPTQNRLWELRRTVRAILVFGALLVGMLLKIGLDNTAFTSTQLGQLKSFTQVRSEALGGCCDFCVNKFLAHHNIVRTIVGSQRE